MHLFPELRPTPWSSALDERYTLREDVQWALGKVGAKRFDLDVAACEESHHAEVWYSREDDGLVKPWFGNVWCNPPYSDIEPWVAKAWASLEMTHRGVKSVSMLLPATRTEQPWWQKLIEPHRDKSPRLTSHFLPGRTRFGLPGNPLGIGVGSPPFACVLLIFRRG
jgi:phage N-6-adenine-methyltransferase